MYIFIINPVSGHGRGRRIFKKVQKTDMYQQMNSHYYYTEYTGHAEKLTQQVCKENLANLKAIIVVGGDGTMHEVLNGLTVPIPVAFIPAGSGNDFARGVGIKKNIDQILKNILDNNVMDYWVANYKLDKNSNRKIVNSIGFGFDAEIADRANRSIYKKIFNRLGIGSLSYAVALIYVLFHFKPFTVELDIDGDKREIHHCWMVAISNHVYYGGGMKVFPHASVQGEHVAVLIVNQISKWKVLGFFLTVFVGKHTRFKEVETYQANKVHIKANKKICYQVDGQTGKCNEGFISKSGKSFPVLGRKD